MSRLRLKPQQPETYYHLMTRTSQRAPYIDDLSGFKDVIEKIIREAAEVYYVEVYASGIMSNHYHLAVKFSMPACDEADVRKRYERHQMRLKRPKPWRDWYLAPYYRRFTDLSKFMQDVNRRIAIAYNQRQDTWGHFWGARYKSLVIEDDESMLKVMSYIEQNPVRAGLAKTPSEYAYCTAGKACTALQQGRPVKIPRIGIFKKLEGETCARAYVMWMDYLCERILTPQNQLRPPPPEINHLFLSPEVLEVWKTEFEEGTASNWRRRTVGSEQYEAEMKARNKSRHEMVQKPSKKGRAADPF